MIPDEAVEAAARALYELQLGQAWGDKPEWVAVYEGYATAALEAAAPHLTQHAPNEDAEAMQKILMTLDAVTAGQVPRDVAFTVVCEIAERWRKEQA